jgi:hypothetical protein
MTREDIDLRDELIILLNAYATFLGKNIDKHAVYLMVHGINATDDEVKMGQKYRDDIEAKIKQIKDLSERGEKKEEPYEPWCWDKYRGCVVPGCGTDDCKHYPNNR